MGIVVKKSGRPPRFNAEGIAKEIQRFAPGAVVERVGRGLDIFGRPFAAYSRRYRNFLKRGGEDQKIDLRLTGGLMNSVKARGALLRADYVEVTIAPDTGTSPVWRPVTTRNETRKTSAARGRGLFGEAGGYSGPLRRSDDKRLAQRLAKTGTMERTGKQSPPHNVVGYWLHNGTPTMKARPWMGLDPKQEAYLREMIARVMWR
jgi:hypothetical protein